MKKKFIVWLSIWISILWLTVPRHGEPVNSTVGRASTTPPISTLSVDEERQYIFNAIEPRDFSSQEASAPVVVSVPPTTVPAPPPTPPIQVSASDDSVWDRLAQCESGGNWAINTGNGYYGGLQFSLSSWRAVGGTGYPHEHSRETQIEMGKRLQASGGWGHWPACSRKLGLR